MHNFYKLLYQAKSKTISNSAHESNVLQKRVKKNFKSQIGFEFFTYHKLVTSSTFLKVAPFDWNSNFEHFNGNNEKNINKSTFLLSLKDKKWFRGAH